MQPVSTDLLAALRGSPRFSVRVDSWRGGELLAADLPVVSGSLSVSAGQAVRGSLSLVVADPDGRYAPKTPRDALAPYGQELVVRLGVRVGQIIEWVQLGIFPIQEVSVNESFGTKQRPTEPGRTFWVSRGAAVSVKASDRAQIVGDAKFLSREQPSGFSIFAEANRLLNACGVPWSQPGGGDALLAAATITYDDDRLAALSKLGDLIDREPAATPGGAVTLAPKSVDLGGAPVWSLGGTDPVTVSISRTMSRSGMFNIAVVRGQSDAAIQSIAYPSVFNSDSDPAGPFHPKPYFTSSNLYTDQRIVEATARFTIDRLMTQERLIVPVEIVPNPALECGDLISIPAPRGNVTGEIRSLTFNLAAAAMRADVSVDAAAYLAVV